MSYKTMKNSSEGLGGNSENFCTSENLQCSHHECVHECGLSPD